MRKPKSRMDEVELAKSIFDEIVEETESEDWNKPKKEKPQKKSTAQSKNDKKSKAQEQV